MIGKGQGVTAGRLLNNGDIVQIGPFLQFTVELDDVNLAEEHKLTDRQRLEIEVRNVPFSRARGLTVTPGILRPIRSDAQDSR